MKKKTKKNSFPPILILAIVIVLAGVGYFGYKNLYKLPSTSQTKIDTTHWKTYTDPKYNYSFKYPAQWGINPPPIGNGILISDQQGPNEDQISLEISSTKLSDVAFPGCKQIQQVLLDNVAASRCELTQEISTERGIVYNPPIISKIVYIETLHNGLYYLISLTFDQTLDKFKIFDQILSTFKFTK